jgi:hypothetical protein
MAALLWCFQLLLLQLLEPKFAPIAYEAQPS